MIRRILLTFVVTQSLASAAAWACSCTQPDHAEDDAIIVGVARGTTMGCGGKPFQNHVTTFDVEDTCRGAIGESVEVWHGLDGDTCGVTFAEGDRVVVFLDEDEDGKLTTSACAGNQAASSNVCPTGF